ncbi:MAG TPA: hypothetical protein VJ885_01935 [Thermoanaerobaculia bacterium]|nr:hypothetical protein [Thermoanaerobaculia bacterium]
MMVRIICGSCQKPVALDENRLPMQAVTFPCPACKAPLTVDRRTLAPAEAPAPPAPVSPISAPSSDSFSNILEDDDDHLGTKALIVGADNPALRQAARDIGLQPVHFPTVEACRDFYLQEYPQVVFLHPAQLSRPPLADMQPVTNLSAPDRRRGYFILVADGLKTMDGTAAFLYDVNLVVAAKDLPSLRRIYRDAEEQHQRFYGAFHAAEKAIREGA